MDDLIDAVASTVGFVFRVLGRLLWGIASVGEAIMDATPIFGRGRAAPHDSRQNDREQA